MHTPCSLIKGAPATTLKTNDGLDQDNELLRLDDGNKNATGALASTQTSDDGLDQGNELLKLDDDNKNGTKKTNDTVGGSSDYEDYIDSWWFILIMVVIGMGVVGALLCCLCLPCCLCYGMCELAACSINCLTCGYCC